MKRLTREWLDKSEDDFNVALSLSRSRKARVPDAICFHSQQCAEKLFKARLCEDGIAFPKTHDLVALQKLLAPAYPLFVALGKAATNLNAYAVNIRYPGDTANIQEARQALKDCRSIREQVRLSFGL
jgi:HEPN domain-containing protein